MFLLTSLAMAIGSTLAGGVAVGFDPALAALIGAALSLLLGIIGARLVTLQAHRLTEVAQAMAADHPERRASVASAGEFQELGDALNHLADKLQRTTAELRGERDRFGVVLEGMVEGVIGLTSDGRVALCNRSATAMLGDAQPPLGKRLLDLVRQPPLQDLLARARAAPHLRPDEVRVGDVPQVELTMPSGAKLLWSAWPLDRAGIGVLLAVRDVTALRRLETVRRDFISNVSHELRTPVAIVYASAEALCDGGLEEPEVARDFAQTILRHAERMSRIISDLLDLSRIEAGAYDLSPSGVQVTERIEHAVRLLAPTTTTRKQTVTTQIQPGLTVRGNAQALDQVLVNLLENASKYTMEGSHIAIGCKADGPRVEMWIADDGPGIPAQHRERIFERFYRIDAGRSRELGGTGLGLAIVRHLVEAMGGNVTCEANEPHGAKFRVWLQA
jgi:two-component system phosphate regulon sensor histidine kinase PhoR